MHVFGSAGALWLHLLAICGAFTPSVGCACSALPEHFGPILSLFAVPLLPQWGVLARFCRSTLGRYLRCFCSLSGVCRKQEMPATSDHLHYDAPLLLAAVNTITWWVFLRGIFLTVLGNKFIFTVFSSFSSFWACSRSAFRSQFGRSREQLVC